MTSERWGWSGLRLSAVLPGHRVYDGRSRQNQEQHLESLSRTSHKTTKSWKLKKINQKKETRLGRWLRGQRHLQRKPGNPSSNSGADIEVEGEKTAPISHPLISTHVLWHIYTHAMTYYTNAMTHYTRAMTHAFFSLSYIMIVTVTHKNTTDFRKIATEG